ncbi:hypothetical protein Vadar_029807 [Vaccinium darrowii]|uniref:Uncharacterized protein n=1 Tax=Vaccinium darrowii TaxID=229202 RepID=A0ACB7XL96_9ERIC|nr:hypothetical protein Vadar_029807 [Vaccinium darrowii]
MRNRGGYTSVDLWGNGVEFNAHFWPIEHPVEPPDEDQPVKCPIPPHSSVINEEGFSDSLRKRTEASGATNKEATMMMVASADEPPPRALRKRHCTSTTHGDHRILTSSHPFRTLPPIRPLNPARHDIIIYETLQQQLNKSES